MSVYYPPVEVVKYEGKIKNIHNLLKEFPLQITLSPFNYATVIGPAYIIFDYGKEIPGGVRVFSKIITGNTHIRFRFGESISECCADIGDKNATNDHQPRDMYVDVPSYSDLKVGFTGFRYVRIDIPEGCTWFLRSVYASTNIDTRIEAGYFESDDKTLNKIWETASYTLRCNLQNGVIWDGIKRDRLCWIGDSFPELKAASCLYGNVPEFDPIIFHTMNTTPLPKWMNGIPAYSLWWINILCEYYMYTGNPNDVKRFIPYLEKLLVQVDKYVSKHGHVRFPFLFIDWETHYVEGTDTEDKKKDETVGTRFLARYTIQNVLTVLKPLIHKKYIVLCEKMLARIKLSKTEVIKYKQIAGLGVAAGIIDENKRKVLMRNGASDLSCFLNYFIFSAMAKFGEYDTALKQIKRFYGGMLKLGATTFFESFDISWLKDCARIDQLPKKGQKDIGDYGKFCYKGFRHSLCHAWSSSIIPYIVENIVGLKCVEPGRTCFTLEPHMSGLNHIVCKYPTPLGMITIKLDIQEDNTLKINVKRPTGIKIKVNNTYNVTIAD